MTLADPIGKSGASPNAAPEPVRRWKIAARSVRTSWSAGPVSSGHANGWRGRSSTRHRGGTSRVVAMQFAHPVVATR